WGITAEVQKKSGFMTIATGQDGDDDASSRVVRVDGKNVSQQALLEKIAVVWLTPDQDRLLADTDSTKRKFIDRLVYGFDPSHATRVNRFERAMAERMRLLRDGPFEPAWLNALEDQMAQGAVAIAAARAQMLAKLNEMMQQHESDFPRPALTLMNETEDAIQHQPALLIEEQMRARYADDRGRDKAAERTHTGPHRCGVNVVHATQHRAAHLCSTGEQKALLIRLMLGYVALLELWRGDAPLLLLDDLASHLDPARRDALFHELRQTRCQFWLTGTDKDTFQSLNPHAQFLRL
ncbi:MAG: DNA replication and repair protein RecF, partial [Alphaproteobacteria bacterium]|nr:DNA replication and repair protein RecF [Alphaproteobacteria bacterium]